MKTTTVGELNTVPGLFNSAEWKLDGSYIVAIHGRDKSTEARYAAAPDGHILLTTVKPMGVQSVRVFAAADAIVTA